MSDGTSPGTLTTYTLDTATPLTRFLAETTGPDTTFTLHGLGLVAQSDGTATEYFSADGLGSVRQLADSTGSVLLNQTFDPYGNPYVRSGAGDTRFGFTGEQVDGNGLVYLRARYYQPEMGRFFQRDTWGGENSRPPSLNPYAYVEGNPILYNDPSGQAVDASQVGISVWYDDRDLTDWLVRQVNANLRDPEIRLIRLYNSMAKNAIDMATVYSHCDSKYAEAVLYKKLAYDVWVSIVKDRARYDYKHAIKRRMGEAIRLCHSGGGAHRGCVWLDYSTPGNVNYGYAGRAAGFTPTELHAGASYAEICDPAHGIDSKWCPINERFLEPDWQHTFYDDPKDYWAIELGVRLYEAHSSGFSESVFKKYLAEYYSSLALKDPPTTAYRNLEYGTKYPVGYFDGDQSGTG